MRSLEKVSLVAVFASRERFVASVAGVDWPSLSSALAAAAVVALAGPVAEAHERVVGLHQLLAIEEAQAVPAVASALRTEGVVLLVSRIQVIAEAWAAK